MFVQFFFHKSCNDIGFFVRNGYGCNNHTGHPMISQSRFEYPARLLTNEEKLVAKSVINADANKGIVRNVVEVRTGISVTLNACHYLGQLGSDLKRITGLENHSSSDRIISFLQEKKYDYIALYNALHNLNGLTVSDLLNDNFISSKSLKSNTKFLVPPNEVDDANDFVSDERNNRKLNNDQNFTQ